MSIPRIAAMGIAGITRAGAGTIVDGRIAGRLWIKAIADTVVAMNRAGRRSRHERDPRLETDFVNHTHKRFARDFHINPRQVNAFAGQNAHIITAKFTRVKVVQLHQRLCELGLGEGRA